MTQILVEEAKVEPGMCVLDIASGTGEPAISIATQLQGTGRVVATDISNLPLEIAEERARELGLNNIEFRIADVHDLPFAEARFNCVVSRLGVMFFSNMSRALSEMRRVLKPAGRTILLAWGPMEQPFFATTVGTVLRLLSDLSLPEYGRQVFKFGTPGKLTAALHEAGFVDAEERYQEVTWDWDGKPEEFWEYFQDMAAPFKELFQAIPPERRREVDEAVLGALTDRYDGQQVRFQANIALASAVR